MAHERLTPDNVYTEVGVGRDEPRSLDDIGYAQVVRAGNQVHVSGTIPVDEEGELVGEDDMRQQVKKIYENIGNSLEAVGATPEEVVRIRIYTPEPRRFLEEGTPETKAFFGDAAKPASTLVECGLALPGLLIEIEAYAVIQEQ